MPPSLVVISYYDQRPVATLIALLDQLRSVSAGALFDLLVVVNAEDSSAPALPHRHKELRVILRENRGMNIGAWQHGWTHNPGYEFYLFLQDECVLRRPGWLAAFRNAARGRGVGFVGESLCCYGSWQAYERAHPGATRHCESVAARYGIRLGSTPDALQTLAIGARADIMERTGGFVEADGKADAIAGEVLTSVRARSLGLRNVQVAWRPFEYIAHPQWADLRDMSGRWTWSLSRAMHLYLPVALNRWLPRRRSA